MTAANATPIGQNNPVPEPVPVPEAMAHEVFVLTVAVVVQSPPSQLDDDVAVTATLICVVSIALSAVTHWPTSLVLT